MYELKLLRSRDIRWKILVVTVAWSLVNGPVSFVQAQTPSTYDYKIENWGPCSVSCGKGVRVRTIMCWKTEENKKVDEAMCSGLTRPITTGNCTTRCAYKYSDWKECSKTCGMGTQSRDASCHRLRKKGVLENIDMHLCNEFAENRPMENLSRSCNIGPCPMYKEESSWSKCSQQCGPGQRIRSVVCQQDGKTVEDHFCSGDKPSASQMCAPQCKFYYSVWGSCNEKCGGGTRSRTELCYALSDTKKESPLSIDLCILHAANRRSDTSSDCNTEDCPQFRKGNWGECSSDCGQVGEQTRRVECIDSSNNQVTEDSVCINKGITKPKNKKSCTPICEYHRIRNWESCSRSCGGGKQTRGSVCLITSPTGKSTSLEACRTHATNKDGWTVELVQSCNKETCPSGPTFPSAPTQSVRPLQDIDQSYQIGQQARVVSRKTLFINCHADGYNITYTWNVALNGGLSFILQPGEKNKINRISISSDGKKLTLQSSSQKDDGNYSCIGTANDSRVPKKSDQRTSSVKVYGLSQCQKPVSQPDRLTTSHVYLDFVCPDSKDLWFPCRITRYYIEYKQYSELAYKQTQAMGPRFVLSGLSPSTRYQIKVKAMYDKDYCQRHGSFSKVVSVTTLARASSSPEKVRISKRTSNSVGISWKKPNDTFGGTLESYGVFYRAVATLTYTRVTETTTTTIRLTSLKPYTSYEVYVVAYTKAADGKVLQGLGSILEQFTTLVGRPSKPKNLDISAGSRVVNASWDRPSTPNGAINYYLVTVSRHRFVYIQNISREEVIIRGLRPYSKYNLSVTAVNVLNGRELSSNKLEASFLTADKHLSPPVCKNVKAINSTAVHILWDEPKPGDHSIKNYTIYVSSVAVATVSSKLREYVVDKLNPSQTYIISLEATAQSNRSSKCLFPGVRTMESEECLLKRPVSLLSSSSRSLLVTWSYPCYSLDEILGYQLFIEQMARVFSAPDGQTVPWKSVERIDAIKLDKTYYNITALQPAAAYRIQIAYIHAKELRSDLENRPKSPSAVFSTLEEAPSHPEKITVVPFLPNKLKVFWSPPLDSREKIRNYTLECSDMNGSNFTYTKWLLPSPLYHIITGLLENHVYVVKIAAVTIAQGPFTVGLPQAMRAEVPSPPREFKTVGTTSSSIQLAWKPPLTPNGLLLNYTVQYGDNDATPYQRHIISKELISEISFNLESLTPNTNYTIYVTVSNNLSMFASFPSAVIKARTAMVIAADSYKNVCSNSTAPVVGAILSICLLAVAVAAFVVVRKGKKPTAQKKQLEGSELETFSVASMKESRAYATVTISKIAAIEKEQTAGEQLSSDVACTTGGEKIYEQIA